MMFMAHFITILVNKWLEEYLPGWLHWLYRGVVSNYNKNRGLNYFLCDQVWNSYKADIQTRNYLKHKIFSYPSYKIQKARVKSKYCHAPLFNAPYIITCLHIFHQILSSSLIISCPLYHNLFTYISTNIVKPPHYFMPLI